MSSNFSNYLDTRITDAGECLHSSLSYLRHSWSEGWLGLPLILSKCISFLNFSEEITDAEINSLLNAAMCIAHQIELEKGCGIGTEEPYYHNRLHFADSITCMTLQCHLEALGGVRRDPTWQAALLLAAISHDFRHPGRTNRFPSDIETASIDALLPFLKSVHLSQLWIERLKIIIMRSDFALVKDNHLRVKDRSFQWDVDWATVLLNESDIMASATSSFGPSLSHALSAEWAIIHFPAHTTVATEEGRRQFLSTIYFSSDSAKKIYSHLK